MTSPDLPRLRWRTDGPIGTIAVEYRAGRWLLINEDLGRIPSLAITEEVSGEDWSELAVVELPPVSVTTTSIARPAKTLHNVHADSSDGKGRRITGRHIPGYTEDRVSVDGAISWADVQRARRDAARILAVCDAVERLRADSADSGGAV